MATEEQIAALHLIRQRSAEDCDGRDSTGSCPVCHRTIQMALNADEDDAAEVLTRIGLLTPQGKQCEQLITLGVTEGIVPDTEV